eukprot:3848713-Prymnesium_polylepis.1
MSPWRLWRMSWCAVLVASCTTRQRAKSARHNTSTARATTSTAPRMSAAWAPSLAALAATYCKPAGITQDAEPKVFCPHVGV